MKLTTIFIAGILALTLQAHSRNLIDDTYGAGTGSFELGSFTPSSADSMFLAVDSTTMTGWTIGNGPFLGTGTGVDWLQSPSYMTADGTKAVDLQGNNASSISIDLPTVIGGKYELILGVSTVGSSGWGIWSAGDHINWKFGVPTSSDTPATQTFIDQSFTFTATSSITTLKLGSNGKGGYGPTIDNVRVYAVPEPSSSLMLGMGLMGMLCFRSIAKRMSL